MRALFPALLVALFAGWCGTLGWGASGGASIAASLALLGAVAVAGLGWREVRDPLGLNPAGRGCLGLLPWALWGWCLLGSGLSPVSRSGRMVVTLLPAFLLLPRAVGRGLATERDRRRAARALAVVASALALWAIGDWLLLGSPRPAMPLGHHNLLALVLVTLLPLAALPARERGPWRWLGRGALLLLGGTVLASRSLAGLTALLAEAGAFALLARQRSAPHRQGRGALGFAALVLLAAVVWASPRLLRLAEGVDPSLRARGVYWRAGVEGFLARPLWGWGAGSTPWTLAAFLDPLPGVNPPGEGVGELHDLPLGLAYELGAPGALLALVSAALFARARLRGLAEGEPGAGERPLAPRAAGLVAALGAAVGFAGSAALGILALPVALTVAAGFALESSPGQDEPNGAAKGAWVVGSYSFAALAILAPLLLAHLRYDQARWADARGDRPGALRSLSGATALDPSFPLYRGRLAWLLAETRSSAEAAEQGWKAARAGGGVAFLWEGAGLLGARAARPWAREAFERAERLDPMSAIPPFWLAASGPDPSGSRTSALLGARALLAEPRLLWACRWRGEPESLAAALAFLVHWPGIDAGWKEAILAAAERLHGGGLERGESRVGAAVGVGTEELALSVDTHPETSLSLHLFHREPWPLHMPAIPLCVAATPLGIPPAWALATTSPSALRLGTPYSSAHRGHDLLTP